jgi:hypothetical protein
MMDAVPLRAGGKPPQPPKTHQNIHVREVDPNGRQPEGMRRNDGQIGRRKVHQATQGHSDPERRENEFKEVAALRCDIECNVTVMNGVLLPQNPAAVLEPVKPIEKRRKRICPSARDASEQHGAPGIKTQIQPAFAADRIRRC